MHPAWHIGPRHYCLAPVPTPMAFKDFLIFVFIKCIHPLICCCNSSTFNLHTSPTTDPVIGDVCPKFFSAKGEFFFEFILRISSVFLGDFGSVEHFGHESPRNDLKPQWRNSISTLAPKATIFFWPQNRLVQRPTPPPVIGAILESNDSPRHRRSFAGCWSMGGMCAVNKWGGSSLLDIFLLNGKFLSGNKYPFVVETSLWSSSSIAISLTVVFFLIGRSKHGGVYV